jgi:hypothetical protein
MKKLANTESAVNFNPTALLAIDVEHSGLGQTGTIQITRR